MRINPLADYILIQPLKEEEKTEAGIILPDTAEKERPEQGKVIAVGPGKKDKDGNIIPIEVKSGSAGRLRSLHLLLKSYLNCPFGLVFSSAPYSELPEQKLKFLPLYYAYSATKRSSTSEHGS